MNTDRLLTRREMLRLSAGTLLSLGLWPGALRAENAAPGGTFSFVVVNDVHFMTDRCGAWLDRVIGKIKAGPQPELCLLVGDQSDHGRARELEPVKEAFARLGAPCCPVIGNHDYLSQTDRADYEKVFPERLNYRLEHQGWIFVGLDSTEGVKYAKTRIQDATLRWLDDHLPKLDKKAPLALFTHFPLGERLASRPLNAEALLDRFREHNLRAVFNGHYHAFTERRSGDLTLVTNRCCSISVANHDSSKEKGYFLCHAKDGQVTREFVEVDTAGLGGGAAPGKAARPGAQP